MQEDHLWYMYGMFLESVPIFLGRRSVATTASPRTAHPRRDHPLTAPRSLLTSRYSPLTTRSRLFRSPRDPRTAAANRCSR